MEGDRQERVGLMNGATQVGNLPRCGRPTFPIICSHGNLCDERADRSVLAPLPVTLDAQNRQTAVRLLRALSISLLWDFL